MLGMSARSGIRTMLPFALSMVSHAGLETPEDASSMTAIQLAKPASASEDFYSSAADEAVEQWNDLKYCPYCFGRDLRMTMSGRRRCKACRAVIKPFEIYRPQ